jgi:hypothetical protein
MNYSKPICIQISSKGLIDLNLLRVIGFSTKRGDNTQFGHFGSGVKYSLALLLRNNIPFKLYNGLEEIVVGAKEQELYSKGEAFRTSTITINDIDTSISTDIGPDWETWMILRELISNAKDQSKEESYIEVTLEPSPKEGFVTWAIDVSKHTSLLSALDNVYKETSYLHVESANYSDLYLKDHPNDPTIVYVKGFNAGPTSKPGLFHFGGNDISIDERRIHRQIYDWRYAELLLRLTDKSYIREVIRRMGDNETLEYDGFTYATVREGGISQEFIECLNEVDIQPATLQTLQDFFENKSQGTIYWPLSTYSRFRPFLTNALKEKDGKLYRELTIQPVDKEFWLLVEQSIEIIATDYPDIWGYEVKVVKFVKDNVYGTVNKESREIYLSDNIRFQPEIKNLVFVLATIFEEFCHIHFDLEDESRKLQNFIFHALANYMIKSNDKIAFQP